MTIPLYFHSLVHSEEVMDMFCDLTRTLMLAFFSLGHCSNKIFQTVHDYKLGWVPLLYTTTRLDDLVSRSETCLKRKL